ncbi:hypothetical protein [Telmatospirillum sp. J64-1]|uniref:hypothetical protein n=1 Tax=Telmatospirillum sp. J64-1 TaxID=2502183 RepID=UPI00115D7C87|nr:hypothetical protein [Telmatospirillum sp. J64-1]
MGALYRGGRFALLSGLLVLLLSGCYLPNKFMAELRISRAGAYALSYNGELIYGPLFRDAMTGKVSMAEAREKVPLYERDLKRDAAFKTVQPVGDTGVYRVSYERESVLDPSQLVSFVRRNAEIFSLRAVDDGRVILQGRTLSVAEANRMMALGLNVEGEFRVVTDARVLEHNAGEVRSYAGYLVYIWKIENALSPAPRLVLMRG